MTHRLPAAAIPVGAVVKIPDTDLEITIAIIENGVPEPGKITWYDELAFDDVIGGSALVEIVSLP